MANASLAQAITGFVWSSDDVETTTTTMAPRFTSSDAFYKLLGLDRALSRALRPSQRLFSCQDPSEPDLVEDTPTMNMSEAIAHGSLELLMVILMVFQMRVIEVYQ